MKTDANVKVPRGSWERARAFALRVGRDVREVFGTAVDEYVKREEKKRD